MTTMLSDDQILERGGTEEDIAKYAHDVGGACGAIYGGTCDQCGKTDETCQICGGTGVIVRDFHDPADHYGHGQTEEKCICQLGNEEADMDDDS